MNARQSTLGEHAANTSAWPPVGRDEWGPTMRRPVPERDAMRCTDDLRLQARGFDPFGLRDELYSRADCHPDDQHREDHHPDTEEVVIRENLARLSDIEQNMRHETTTDDGQSNEPQATDPARSTTRAVADGGEVRATMQEYRDAHPDYRGEVNGRPAVLKMTPNGTALIPVEEGGD